MTREVLWNGNREPLTGLLRWNPEHNVLRWAWTRHPELTRRYEGAMGDRAYAHLTVVRLRSHADADAWLAGFERVS